MNFSPNCEFQLKLWFSVEIVNFSPNCEIQSQLWNSVGNRNFQLKLWISVEIVNFSRNCEFQFKLWNSVEIVKVSQDSINSSWSWIDEKSEKSALANTVSLKEQMHQVKMASSRNEDCLEDEVRIAWRIQMPRYRSTGWSWKVVIGVRWSWDVEELNKLPPSPVHRQLSVLEGPKEKFPAF